MSPQGAFMVFPCIGSVTHVTIWPAPRTARIRCGSFTLVFSGPILAMMVILPALFSGFNISINRTSSAGSILSLTCITLDEGVESLRKCLTLEVFKCRVQTGVGKCQHNINLDTKRVGNASKELHMSTIKLASPLSDP